MKDIFSDLPETGGLLLHHWDTDGMVSASFILDELPKEIGVTTFTPMIGNYYLEEKDRENIEDIDPDFVIVVDMALPSDSIDFLKNFGKAIIFDHHLQDKHDVHLHQNPVIDGASPKEYPSATWVVSEFLEREPNFKSVLGAFGDREEKLKENKEAMETVNTVLKELDVDFDTMLECIHLLDSNYKLGNRGDITDMPRRLRSMTHPDDVLGLEELQENREKLDEAIDQEINAELEELKEDVLYREMESPYNIISPVTRRLAWSRDGKKVVVSNSNFMEDGCQIYIRGPIPDSEAIIQKAKDRDYSAGGKSDVVGMVIPQADKEEFLDEIVEML